MEMVTALMKNCPECGKSYTPKTSRFGDQDYTHYVPACSCETREWQKKERAAEIKRLVNLSNLPGKYKSEDIRNWCMVPGTEGMTEMVRDYLKDLDHNMEVGRSMLWVGANGTGKTWLLSWMNKIIIKRKVCRSFFIDADQLSIRLAGMRDGSREMIEFANMLTNVTLLNLDDFGGADVAIWKKKYISHTLFQRYYNKKTVFFSTNSNFADLEQIHGKAVMSRIMEMCGPSYILEIKSKVDMRLEVNRREYGHLRIGDNPI